MQQRLRNFTRLMAAMEICDVHKGYADLMQNRGAGHGNEQGGAFHVGTCSLQVAGICIEVEGGHRLGS